MARGDKPIPRFAWDDIHLRHVIPRPCDGLGIWLRPARRLHGWGKVQIPRFARDDIQLRKVIPRSCFGRGTCLGPQVGQSAGPLSKGPIAPIRRPGYGPVLRGAPDARLPMNGVPAFLPPAAWTCPGVGDDSSSQRAGLRLVRDSGQHPFKARFRSHAGRPLRHRPLRSDSPCAISALCLALVGDYVRIPQGARPCENRRSA